MFGIRYNVTVTFSQAFRQFRLICGLVDVWALESSSFSQAVCNEKSELWWIPGWPGSPTEPSN